MNFKKTCACLAVLTFLLGPALAKEAKELSGREILDKANELNEADSRSAGMTMLLVDKDGETSSRQISFWSKGDDKRLIKFLSPADVKGVGFLVLNADSDDEKMYLYLPAFKKVRRIAGSAKSGSFMGSDFSYDEISVTGYDQDFEAKRLDDEDGRYKLELTKKDKSDAEYDRLIMWVSKEVFVPTRIEMYKEKKRSGKTYLELRKIMSSGQIKQVGKYWMPHAITMEDVKKNHKTVLELSRVKVDDDVPENYFTTRYLQR
jgi:outer membrane lipoprotein-sorting protein